MSNNINDYDKYYISVFLSELIESYSTQSDINIPGNIEHRIKWITNIDWANPEDSGAYIRRYLKRYTKFTKYHIEKLIGRQEKLNTLVVADLGCGPGTASLALLDLIHERTIFPDVKHVIIELIDHKLSALNCASNIIRNFVNKCNIDIRLELITNMSFTYSDRPLRMYSDPRLILCTNMICELINHGQRDKLIDFFRKSDSYLFASDCVRFDDFDRFSSSLSLTPVRVTVTEPNSNTIYMKYIQKRGNF